MGHNNYCSKLGVRLYVAQFWLCGFREERYSADMSALRKAEVLSVDTELVEDICVNNLGFVGRITCLLDIDCLMF